MLILIKKDVEISNECRAMDFDVTDRKTISIIYDKDTNRIRSIMLIDYDKEVGDGFCQTFHTRRSERLLTDDIVMEDGKLDTVALEWYDDRFIEEEC